MHWHLPLPSHPQTHPKAFSSVPTAPYETKYKNCPTFVCSGKSHRSSAARITGRQSLSKNVNTMSWGRCVRPECLCIINLECMLCLWEATWPLQIRLKLGKWAKLREGMNCCSPDNKSEQKRSFHFVVKVNSNAVSGWMLVVHLVYYVTIISFFVFSTPLLYALAIVSCVALTGLLFLFHSFNSLIFPNSGPQKFLFFCGKDNNKK